MQPRFKWVIGLAVVVAASGCYNARVNTGLAPGPQIYKENWAPSWIFGAVSPPAVDAASRCPSGVAQVHTYHSFLNILVGSLTSGIFTPLTIHVTCAARGEDAAGESSTPEMEMDGEATMDAKVKRLQDAADLSALTGQPVIIRF